MSHAVDIVDSEQFNKISPMTGFEPWTAVVVTTARPTKPQPLPIKKVARRIDLLRRKHKWHQFKRWDKYTFLKMGHSRPPFSLFSSFQYS